MMCYGHYCSLPRQWLCACYASTRSWHRRVRIPHPGLCMGALARLWSLKEIVYDCAVGYLLGVLVCVGLGDGVDLYAVSLPY